MCRNSVTHVHNQRFIVNSTVNREIYQQEVAATKNEYLQWFATYQAANRFLVGRSYAQVLSCTPRSDTKKSQAHNPVRGCNTNDRYQRR